MSTKPDLLQCLCLGCEKNEPHYEFYRADYVIYAYFGQGKVSEYGITFYKSTLHYNPETGSLTKMLHAGSYRDASEPKIKLNAEFFDLSPDEKVKNLRKGVYDV